MFGYNVYRCFQEYSTSLIRVCYYDGRIFLWNVDKNLPDHMAHILALAIPLQAWTGP
jgi:hypothetical protein